MNWVVCKNGCVSVLTITFVLHQSIPISCFTEEFQYGLLHIASRQIGYLKVCVGCQDRTQDPFNTKVGMLTTGTLASCTSNIPQKMVHVPLQGIIGIMWTGLCLYVVRVSPVNTSLQVESQYAYVALCSIVCCACVLSYKQVLCCVLTLNVFVAVDIRCLAFRISLPSFLTLQFSLSYVLTKRTYFPVSHYLTFSFRDLCFDLSVLQYVTLIKAWESWCIQEPILTLSVRGYASALLTCNHLELQSCLSCLFHCILCAIIADVHTGRYNIRSVLIQNLCVYFGAAVHFALHQPGGEQAVRQLFLTWGPLTPWGSADSLQGSVKW